MSKTILKIDNLSKQYRLGNVGTGSLAHDLNRAWHSLRGKEDPYLQIGAVNDRSITASSDYVWALKDINFEVKQGEILGIIGKNGAGKSTLLKILSRVTSPTTGSIKVGGRMASLLEVGTGMHPELTGRENIFLNGAILGMNKAEISSKIDEIVEFSGCQMYIDTPVKRYSSGMRVRLGFAVAAFLEPDILVIDEVLAVGDAEFQKKAIGKMQDISSSGGRTVLFVSHDMNAVAALTNKVIVLENGTVVFAGSTKKGIENYLSGSDKKLYYVNELKGSIPSIQKVSIQTSLAGNQHEHGLPIKVNFEIYLPYSLKNLALSFQVLDELQTPIMHTWQIDSEFNIQREKGMLKLLCEIPKSRLYMGNYNLNVHLSDSKTKQKFEFIEGICHFEVGMTNSMRSDYNWSKGTAKYIEETNWTEIKS